jgi:hypothetical protein
MKSKSIIVLAAKPVSTLFFIIGIALTISSLFTNAAEPILYIGFLWTGGICLTIEIGVFMVCNILHNEIEQLKREVKYK